MRLPGNGAIQDRAALMAAVPLPVLHITPDLRLAQGNQRAEALLGSAAFGRHFGLTLRQPALVEAIEAVMAGAEAQQLRCRLVPDEHDHVYDVTVAPAPGGGAYCSFFDVTEQELVGQLRRDFVANVSHELRTPLTALLGFIETLQGPARDDAAARARFLGIMAREAERMARLVRDLLSLSRVEAQERMRPEARVDVAAVVAGVLATLRPMAEAAGVALELRVEQSRPVRADADQLTQVFHNLVENAVKYGGTGKLVTVTLRREEEGGARRGPVLAVAVEDRGEGIAAQHLPRLTERFYRVDAHRSR
ncbi:MAG: PAS domain-containing protein, partial [Gemmobacter sp.]|nr:PAS domain-containing protein [Gemmobacter sp.]